MELASVNDNNENRDPGWKYCTMVIPGNRTKLECIYCHGVYTGGIRRLKEHLAGGYKNAKACCKCSPAVREEMREYMQRKQEIKAHLNIERQYKMRMDKYKEEPPFEEAEEPNYEDVPIVGSKRSGGSSTQSTSVSFSSKRQNVKGPIDMYFASQGKKVATIMKSQKEENDKARKELRDRACQQLAQWFYDAGISFDSANYDSFQEMVEAIGQYGPNLNAPSCHELSVPLLNKEVEIITKAMQDHEKEWEKNGCSLMCDGWKDRKERTIVNFLVNSTLGSMFLESVDASDYAKSGDKLFLLLIEKVEMIGPSKVIQVVTDSSANNKLAGKLLQAKYPHIFWTPSAAHCIDLILEDIFKKPVLAKTHKSAIKLTSYIYNRPEVVNLLRKFTNNMELISPAKTRFATASITMSRLHQLKKEIRELFTSQQWQSSKWAKKVEGKQVTQNVLSVSFWNNLDHASKISSPLVDVLRLVDGEKKPPMGYIYVAMDRAKEEIANSFNNNTSKYHEIIAIIDERWDVQRHHPLYAAGNLLNPEYFYEKPNLDPEVYEGFITCVTKMFPHIEDQDQIAKELELYKHAKGLFGHAWAIRHRKMKSPAEWWSCYGGKAPKLQQFAIRVLSLTCSSSGYGRNVNMFEDFHNKRRNRLAQKRLNDLVFVKLNRALMHRFQKRDLLDPISLDHIDESCEWLTGVLDEENTEDPTEVHDSLSLIEVERASGVGEPTCPSRSNAKRHSKTSTPVVAVRKKVAAKGAASHKNKGKAPINGSRSSLRLVDEEDNDIEEEEEEEEG